MYVHTTPTRVRQQRVHTTANLCPRTCEEYRANERVTPVQAPTRSAGAPRAHVCALSPPSCPPPVRRAQAAPARRAAPRRGTPGGRRGWSWALAPCPSSPWVKTPRTTHHPADTYRARRRRARMTVRVAWVWASTEKSRRTECCCCRGNRTAGAAEGRTASAPASAERRAATASRWRNAVLWLVPP